MMSSHIHAHTIQTPFNCEFPGCGKSFKTKGALKYHRALHTGETLYRCHFCCPSKRYLKTHELIHTGENPFICPYEGCPYKCKQKALLTQHIRNHTGELRFHCKVEGCRFACVQSSQMLKHMRKEHQFEYDDCFNKYPHKGL